MEKKKNMDVRYGDTPQTTFELIRSIAKTFKIPIDFSSYDQTLPSFTIVAFFLIMKALLKLNENESKVFDYMVSYIINAPIYHEDTGLVSRYRGIISGSLYTNIADSFCNCMILGMANNKNNGLDRAIVYGDDNILVGERRFPNINAIEHYLNTLGMKIT